MTFLSKEYTEARLTEFRILLKYISFLKQNGFSDCGKGQILGQISVLEEFLNENNTSQDMPDLPYNQALTNSNKENLITVSDAKINDNQDGIKIDDSKTIEEKYIDFDNALVESEYTNNDNETKLQNSRWLQPFRNDTELKKKSPDHVEKNEIVQSWKEKIRKMTQSEII